MRVLRQVRLHIRGQVAGLRLVHHFDGADVAHVGKVGGHAEVRPAHRRLHVGDRRRVFLGHQFGDGRIGLHVTLVGVLDAARFHRGSALVDDPLLAVVAQAQADDAQVLAPQIGHHGGHAVHQATGLVDAGQIKLRHRAGGVREQLVRMADQHGVHARHLRQVVIAVFHAWRIRTVIQAAVRNGHHQFGALGAHLGDEFFRRLAHALGVDPAFQPALVPGHDGRRREADDADLHGAGDGLAIGAGGRDLLVDDVIRREQRLAALHAVDVGQHLRERGAGAARLGGIDAVDVELVARHLAQKRQAVVEFMVADAAAVNFQQVHGLVDGQRLVAGQRFDEGLVVGQRRALDGVAIVEQERVRELGPRLRDQGRRAFQADRRLRLQLVVIITEHVGVQVRRLQQGQGSAAACLRGGQRVGRSGGGGRQGAAAGQQQRQQGKAGKLAHEVFLLKDNIASIIRSTPAPIKA
ncbi:hypothetical protein D3C81_599520 [compost metagenome]